MEDGEQFYKNQISFFFAIILVYSKKDILNYLSQKLNLINFMNEPGLEEFANVKIPKITYEQIYRR